MTDTKTRAMPMTPVVESDNSKVRQLQQSIEMTSTKQDNDDGNKNDNDNDGDKYNESTKQDDDNGNPN